MSRYIWERTEDLRKAAEWLQKGAHLCIRGLPGAGKSTFVRQLTSSDVRERFGLGRQYLIVLLDGREFADLSREVVWGAISGALRDAQQCDEARICSRLDARPIDFCELREVIRTVREYRVLILLDHCSSLCAHGDCVCDHLLHLSKKRFLSLVAVPTPRHALFGCAGDESDQFVPMHLPLLPSAQAYEFLARALPPLDIDCDLEHDLRENLVSWVGGSLTLLDSACDLAVKLRKNYRDIVMLYHWPPNREWRRLCEQGFSKGDSLRDYPEFRGILGELCSLDARSLYKRWWRVLSERERAVVLALNELQRIDSIWKDELERLVRKGVLLRRGNRYVLFPELWDDYVSQQPATCRVGPFCFSLKDIQTVYVRGQRCRLSSDQAGIFFRLFLQRDRLVPYTRLLADLYAPRVDVPRGRLDQFSPLAEKAVDLEIDQLCKALGVGSETIERIPPGSEALHSVLDGYRLAVSSHRARRLSSFSSQ